MMRHPLAALSLVLLLATACGSPQPATLGQQSGAESRECQEALRVRTEVLQRIDRDHAAAVKAKPAARANADRIRDDARQQIAAAANLQPCEDGNPATGVAVDIADLRQRLTVVADRTSVQLKGPQPPAGKDSSDD